MPKNKENLFNIFLVFFFSFIFSEVILTSDSLRHFDAADNFVKEIYKGSFIAKDLLSNIPFWVLQNSIIIFFFNFLEFFFFKIDLIFFSKYFISYLHSLYMCLSFYICYQITKTKTSKFNGLIVSLLIFFSTGLIYFFSSTYIENLVVLLFFLRYYLSNRFFLLLIDLIFCLIKPFYLIFVIYFIFFNEKKIFKKKLNNCYYLIFLIFLLIYLFFLGSFSYLQFIMPSVSDTMNVNFSDIKNLFFISSLNFIDIIFSNTSGIINTLFIIIILILFGFDKLTKYKIITFLVFIFILSFFNFWYSHLPLSGRYILSTIPFFLKEITNGFIFLYKNKNQIVIKIFFMFTFFINIINLPTINFKNTSYMHYSKNVITAMEFQDVDNHKRLFHPINDYKFHQFLFNIKYVETLIKKNKSFIFVNKRIDIENIYPSVGLLRLSFLLNTIKIYEIDRFKIMNIPSFILNFQFIDLGIFLINSFVIFICSIYFFINLKFLFNIFRK